MENEVVKVIYKFMQDMKLKINNSNNQKDHYEKAITKAKLEEDEVVEQYNRFIIQANILKFKFYFLCLITFGLYYKKEKYDYKLRKDILEGALSDLNRDYDNIVSHLSVYEQEKEKCENQISEFKKYFNQMDMFIECVNSMTMEEKEKNFNYRR